MIRQLTITKIDNGWIVADDGSTSADGKNMLPPKAVACADATDAIKVSMALMEPVEGSKVFVPKIIK